MKTETIFWNFGTKIKILEEAKKGNQYAIDALFRENERLEGRIKDVEIGITMLIDKSTKRSCPADLNEKELNL